MSAPISRARASFSSLLAVAKTLAPVNFAICSPALPTPPPTPRIKTSSPGRSWARVISMCHAVRYAIGIAAALMNERVSGI